MKLKTIRTAEDIIRTMGFTILDRTVGGRHVKWRLRSPNGREFVQPIASDESPRMFKNWRSHLAAQLRKQPGER